MENLRKTLDEESTKRTQLEKNAITITSESAKLKDQCVKLDRELNKAQKDLSQREWEIKQLESKQDKTIVEHVHVLQEAKAFTDRQLAQAQAELEKQKGYIKSLEKTKARLTGETEDLTRQTEKEKQELRAKEKAVRAIEDKATRALTDLEAERRSRESAELQSRRLQDELKNVKSQLDDTTKQMRNIKRSKETLESELEKLALDGDQSASSITVSQYEARIAQLEAQAQESNNLRSTADRIKERIEKQHAELRNLIASSNPKDDNFRLRLLRELELAERELGGEFAGDFALRPTKGKMDGTRSYALVTPSKKPMQVNGNGRVELVEVPRTPERKANQLQQQLQVLELQMLASERVRRHLQSSLQDLGSELESSDGSNASLEAYRARLARENARLAELLDDEAQARRSTEVSHLGGVQSLLSKFENTISEERESYTKLEESRKALVSADTLPFKKPPKFMLNVDCTKSCGPSGS